MRLSIRTHRWTYYYYSLFLFVPTDGRIIIIHYSYSYPQMDETTGWNCLNVDPNATSCRMGKCASKGGPHKSNYFVLAKPGASASTRERSTGVEVLSEEGANALGASVLVQSHDCPGLCLTAQNGNSLTAGRGAGRMDLGLAPCTAAAAWERV
jgi:hypothetical protein